MLSLYGMQRCSLLRSFCQKTGVQLRLREYFNADDNSSSLFFSDEDVLNVFPCAKHINPRASDAYNFYTTGQSKIQQGYLKDGCAKYIFFCNVLHTTKSNILFYGYS